MAEKESENNQFNQIGPNIIDLEERQRIVKDRLLLVGQNLIDLKEKNEEEMLSLKKEMEILKSTVERMKEFIETISSEFSSFAKKSDLEILRKQAKMFQPLDFVRKSDLEKINANKSLEKLKSTENQERT